MSRLGLGLFDTYKYGVPPTNTNKLWWIKVDWDEDYVYDPYNEAPNCTDLVTMRGRQHFIRLGGEGYERPRPGRCTLLLKNTDSRYDPFNDSGDLYPNVGPGKAATIGFRDGIDGTDYDLFTGVVDSIEPVKRHGLDFVRMKLVDGWEWLQSEDVYINVQENQDVGTLIGLILDDVDWPSLWGRSLATGDLIVPYWWATGESAAALIHGLASAEGGYFYLAGDGTATFTNRNAESAEQITIDESEMHEDMHIPQPWEVVKNRYEVVVYPTTEEVNKEVWSLGTTPEITAGSNLELWVNLRYENRPVVATSITTPVATTDYTANAAEDGSGADMTSDFDITVDTLLGETVKITITNNHASTTGFVTFARLRGDIIDIPHTFKLVSDESGSSQPRVFKHDLRAVQEVVDAEVQLTYLSSLLGTVHQYPRVAITERFNEQYGADLTQYVRVNIPTRSIDNQGYRIGRIIHRWLHPTGQAVKTELWFEPFADIDIFTLDVDTLDSDAVLG